MAGDTWFAPEPPLAPRRGVLVSVEGVWGAGKTTVASRLGQRLTDAGFDATVMHYGPRLGVVGKLSAYLEDSPLRSRSGTGGYAHPHHATVDVLLRLCREAYHHTHLYRPALATHDVVVLDHGVYCKLAYALAVLTEQHPDRAESELLDQIRACAAPWFVHPDRAFFLDVPWPLARERAIGRGRGGGNPGSVERLLFLPHYTAAYRQVITAHPQRVCRIHVGARGVESVLAEIENHLSVLLRTSLGAIALPRDRARDGLPFRAVTPSCPIWRVDAVASTPELVSGSSHGRRAGAAGRGDGHRRRHDHGLSRSRRRELETVTGVPLNRRPVGDRVGACPVSGGARWVRLLTC